MANKGYRKPNAKKRSVRQRGYQGKPAQRKNRSSRNKARKSVVKRRGKSAVKGKDVHHRDGNPRNNSTRNLAVTSKKKNRSRK